MFIHRLTGEKIIDPREFRYGYQQSAAENDDSADATATDSKPETKPEAKPNPPGSDEYLYDDDNYDQDQDYDQQQNYDEEIPEPEEKIESKSCSANEEWKQCGSACPPTCHSPNPEICIKQCIAGCFCKEGYLLHEGDCVAKADCPGK